MLSRRRRGRGRSLGWWPWGRGGLRARWAGGPGKPGKDAFDIGPVEWKWKNRARHFRLGSGRHPFGRRRQACSWHFLRRRRRTSGRRPFPRRRAPLAGWRPLGLQGRRIHIAEDDRQAVFTAADDHDLRVRGLRQLKRCLDAAPTQIGIRDPLADDALELVNAFRLDLLAFRLSFLSLYPKFVFLRDVVLLGLAID